MMNEQELADLEAFGDLVGSAQTMVRRVKNSAASAGLPEPQHTLINEHLARAREELDHASRITDNYITEAQR